MAQHRELVEYLEPDGTSPFRRWLERLRDVRARARVDARLLRIRLGNLGDAKAVGGGVQELRIHYGPGYRVYLAQDGERIVVLLAGGSKATQASDIAKARLYWERYRQRGKA
jgi:putative addiction module killer protein